MTSSIWIGHLHDPKLFGAYIKERPDLVRHPSFLILILVQIDLNIAEVMLQTVERMSLDVEMKTRHGAQFIHKDWGDLKRLDLPAMTKYLHELVSFITSAERMAKIWLLPRERIAEFDKRVQEAGSLENSLEWYRNAEEMRQHAQWMEDSFRFMRIDFESFAENAQSQMDIVYRKSSNTQQTDF